MIGITKPQGTGNDRPSIGKSKFCHNLPGCSKLSTTIAMSPVEPVDSVAKLLATCDAMIVTLGARLQDFPNLAT